MALYWDKVYNLCMLHVFSETKIPNLLSLGVDEHTKVSLGPVWVSSKADGDIAFRQNKGFAWNKILSLLLMNH